MVKVNVYTFWGGGGGVKSLTFSLLPPFLLRGQLLKESTWLASQGSWVRYPVWQHTFVSPSAFSRRAVVSYWRKYVHEVLVNRWGGLSLPRKSVVTLTDRPDMIVDVYRGRKTTIQHQQREGKHSLRSFITICAYTFLPLVEVRRL